MNLAQGEDRVSSQIASSQVQADVLVHVQVDIRTRECTVIVPVSHQSV